MNLNFLAWENNNPLNSFIKKTAKMQKNRKSTAGIFLIILSTLLFISLLGVPLVNVAGKTKITISTVLVILGEVTFWAGSFLLGKELVNKYKAYLNPMNWYKKKNARAEVVISENPENLRAHEQITSGNDN